jgi:hypothetical protein
MHGTCIEIRNNYNKINVERTFTTALLVYSLVVQ